MQEAPFRCPNSPSLLSFLRLTCLLFPFALSHTPINFNRQDDEDNVREAVLRKQMMDWVSGHDKIQAESKNATEKAITKQMNFKIFFVSVNGADPSNDLLTRFRNVARIVKKASASKTRHWTMTVADKATGQRGIIFNVGAIRWLTQDSAEVEGGYSCDGLCGLWKTFQLQAKDGKWMVITERVHAIS